MSKLFGLSQVLFVVSLLLHTQAQYFILCIKIIGIILQESVQTMSSHVQMECV